MQPIQAVWIGNEILNHPEVAGYFVLAPILAPWRAVAAFCKGFQKVLIKSN